MKKTYALIISLCCFGIVVAQNYQVLRSDRTVFYESTIGNYPNTFNCIRIDSVQMLGQDSILYPSPTIYQVSENCYEPFGPTLLGGKIVKQANGHNLLFNKHNDTIVIYTKAKLGESWVIELPNNNFLIQATVIDHKLEQFLDLSDSVKTIQFQPLNEIDSASLPIFGLNIKLSKNYGLIQSVDFREFPYKNFNSAEHKERQMLGLTNPKQGIKNLTWFDVHDFQIGDEFHIVSGLDISGGFSNPFCTEGSSYRKSIERILYREDVLNEADELEQIIYRVSVEYSRIQWSDSTIFYNIDTINRTIQTFIPNVFDSLPGITYKRNNEYNFGVEYTQNRMFFNNENLAKVLPVNHIDHICYTDSCWTKGYCVIDGSMRIEHYLKGLGGPYYKYEDMFNCSSIRDLVYYDKGDEVWGMPLDLTDIEDVQLEDWHITIQPNPAQNNFNFIIQQKYLPLQLKVFDLNGNSVLSEKVNSSATNIQINHLSEGMYFAVIDHEKYTLPIQKLLINR